MSTTVRDVMTTQAVAVTKDASFKDVAVMLRQHQVSSFPVVDADGRVVGVVSEGDMPPKEPCSPYPGPGFRPANRARTTSPRRMASRPPAS